MTQFQLSTNTDTFINPNNWVMKWIVFNLIFCFAFLKNLDIVSKVFISVNLHIHGISATPPPFCQKVIRHLLRQKEGLSAKACSMKSFSFFPLFASEDISSCFSLFLPHFGSCVMVEQRWTIYFFSGEKLHCWINSERRPTKMDF